MPRSGASLVFKTYWASQILLLGLTLFRSGLRPFLPMAPGKGRFPYLSAYGPSACHLGRKGTGFAGRDKARTTIRAKPGHGEKGAAHASGARPSQSGSPHARDGEAAVDADRLAGDEARFRRIEKEQRSARDLGRRAVAPLRGGIEPGRAGLSGVCIFALTSGRLRTAPGASALTRMPKGASSTANTLVMVMTPPFEAP